MRQSYPQVIHKLSTIKIAFNTAYLADFYELSTVSTAPTTTTNYYLIFSVHTHTTERTLRYDFDIQQRATFDSTQYCFKSCSHKNHKHNLGVYSL